MKESSDPAATSCRPQCKLRERAERDEFRGATLGWSSGTVGKGAASGSEARRPSGVEQELSGRWVTVTKSKKAHGRIEWCTLATGRATTDSSADPDPEVEQLNEVSDDPRQLQRREGKTRPMLKKQTREGCLGTFKSGQAGRRIRLRRAADPTPGPR